MLGQCLGYFTISTLIHSCYAGGIQHIEDDQNMEVSGSPSTNHKVNCGIQTTQVKPGLDPTTGDPGKGFPYGMSMLTYDLVGVDTTPAFECSFFFWVWALQTRFFGESHRIYFPGYNYGDRHLFQGQTLSFLRAVDVLCWMLDR